MSAALVIDGHPNPDSLTAAIARAYAEGYGDARLLALRDLDFDVHMRFGYRQRMPLEPDLADAKRALDEARRVVVVTPMWWGSVPALLKGFFDRALLPHQEYRYNGSLPEGLLRGRRGRVFVLADTPWYAAPFTGLPADSHLARNTLKFVGVRPVRVHRLLGVKGSSDARLHGWIRTARERGASDARADVGLPAPATPAYLDELVAARA